MDLFKKIFAIPVAYENADYKTRHLVRLINLLSLSLFLIVPMVVVYAYFVVISVEFGIFIPFLYGIIAIGAMQYFLRKGQFQVASVVFSYTPAIVVWLIIFSELETTKTVLPVADTFQFALVFMFLSIFINDKKLMTPLYFLFNLVALVVFTHMLYEKGLIYDLEYNEFLGDGILTIVMLYLVTTAVYHLYNSSLEKTLEESKKARELSESLEIKVKERTEELERQKDNYQELVENANSIIVRWSGKGRITYFNECAEDVFQYDRNEVLGMPFIDAIVPQSDTDDRELLRLMENICDHPEEFKYVENENCRKDGSRLWVAWTNKAYKNQETGEVEVLSIGSDITESKRARVELEIAKGEAEAAHAELKKAQNTLIDGAHTDGKNEVVTFVLHNIGNILNSLVLRSEGLEELLADNSLGKLFQANEMLKEHEDDLENFIIHNPKSLKLAEYYLSLDEALRQELNKAQYDISQIRTLIVTMQDVINTQLHQKSQEYIRENVEPREVVQSVSNALAFKMKSLNIRFSIICNNNQPVTLHMSRITIILHAIMSNAIEALEEVADASRAIIVTIDQHRGMLELSIEDTGEGIDEGSLNTIFGLGSSTKGRTGFGLHNAANLVEEIGGSIGAESEGKGLGSTIHIVIPIPIG